MAGEGREWGFMGKHGDGGGGAGPYSGRHIRLAHLRSELNI